MSEWNLSVRLTGQGSSLSRTLRDTARDAQTASRRVNALTRDLTRLRAEASRDIRLNVRLDAGNLRQELRTAVAAADSGQALTVNLRLANAMQLRRDVENAVRWAAWGHRIEIPIRLADPMRLRRDVSAAVRRASTSQTVRVRVTADTSALTGLTRTLGGGSSSRGGGAGLGLQSILMLAPAAIPLLAGLSSNAAPLAGQFVAAGGAATAFAIAIAGQIEPLSEVADAEKKYQKAVREHGRSSAEAMQAQLAYQQLLADMPAETQKAAIALATLKEYFGAWSDQMSSFTMVPVTKGITVLDQLIPRLTPEVQAFSTHLDRLMNVAGGAISTPGFDAFADHIAALTDQKLDEFTDDVIHLIRVVSEGDVGNGALGQILSYAKDNGPEAREAIQAIGQAVIVLAEGASQAGPTMLTLVTAAARLVSALPPELVGIIIQVATALKLLKLAGVGMAAVAAGVTRVRTAITGLTTASAAAGGGLAGLSAAFATLGTAAKASLVVAGIAAVVLVLTSLSDLGKEAPPDVDKLTTSLGKLGQTGKVTGEALRAFGPDLEGLGESLRTLARPSNLDKSQQFLTKLIGMDSTPVKDAKKDFDAVDKSLTALVRGGKADVAAAALERVIAGLKKQGFTAKEVKAQLDGYQSALADQAFEQELAAQAMGVFGQAALDTQAKLDAQKQSADGLRQSIIALNEVNRAAGGAMNAFEQAIDDAAEAAKTNAGALKMNHGELDLSSQKARDAESALRDLAANTDDAAAKAREQGKSWEYVQGIMDRGRDKFVAAAQTMGLTKTQAEALARSYLGIPESKTTTLEMRTEDAIAGLDSVIAAIQKTPGKKSVTVSALTQDAVGLLTDLGFKVEHLKDGRFKVTADTATAKGSLAAVQAARDGLKNKTITIEARDRASAAVRAIQAAIAGLRNRTVTITTVRETIAKYSTDNRPTTGQGGVSKYASGGVVDYYADGGIQRGGVRYFAGGAERHIAQFARAGTWRVWGEPETGGEAYIPLAPTKRERSRAIAEETVRRLGGNPAAIQWNAAGSVTDWRYDPTSGSLYSASDAGQAGHKTKKVKVKGKVKEVDYFDLGAVEKRLKSISKATTAWNKDLEKVADRVGGDVADALAAMGEDGMKLAHKMATGSTKYINDMAKALRNLQATAKASLTDYTRQLGKANTVNKQFSDDLAKLAAQGYGDLASQLAAQGDEAAQQLAAAAVKDKKKASAANAQAKKANNALTGDEISELVQIIAAISSNKIGIHDVAGKTGLGEDEIITVANKAKQQISTNLGSKASKFLSDLAKANAHQAYANGGIRAGLYATQGGIYRFAEPETHGEALIPLGPNKRRTAMPVLADVARRFGVGLTDVAASRAVLVIREGGDTHVNVTAVRTGATASDIGFQVGRSVRRARRGGVAARAGS